MNSFLLAWRVARFTPRGVIRAASWSAAMVGWARHTKPTRRLEENLARVTGLEGRQLRQLSRQGMASTARYYAEVLEMPRVTPAVVDARVRIDGLDAVRHCFREDKGTVAVLGHLGNWDLVGAKAAQHVISITAVAEVLKPREVFEEFVRMRDRLGIRVLGHEGGSTFRELIRITGSQRTLVCLLADRDISGSGVEVQMWGHGVKVAPGPAALSQTTSTWLVPVFVHSERLHGARRRAAKSRWGIVMSFGAPLDPADFTGPDRVREMSQAWAGQMGAFIARHPQDWHMLQRFGWVES